MVAAVLWRRALRPWRIEAFVALAPAGVSSPLSATPTSARDSGWTQLRAAAAWSRHGLLVRGAWTQTQWNALVVERRQGYSLHTVARHPVVRFEALLRNDRTDDQELEAESPGAWEATEEHRLLLRLVFPVGGGMLSVERRSRVRLVAGPATPRAVGWRLGLRQQHRQNECDVSAAFFEAMPGASLVFSEAAVGPAPVLFYGSGTGMQFAVRLRHQWRQARFSLRASIGSTAPSQWQSVVEAGVQLRLSGANGF
jgi:hypothetical protein